MANLNQKRVKGILKKHGFFQGFKLNKVYEFAIMPLDDNIVELSIWDGDARQAMSIPANYVKDIVEILDGPGADVLFNKNK